MKGKRRRHSAELKSKVAAIRGVSTVQEIASKMETAERIGTQHGTELFGWPVFRKPGHADPLRVVSHVVVTLIVREDDDEVREPGRRSFRVEAGEPRHRVRRTGGDGLQEKGVSSLWFQRPLVLLAVKYVVPYVVRVGRVAFRQPSGKLLLDPVILGPLRQVGPLVRIAFVII